MLLQIRTKENKDGQLEIIKERVNEVNLGSINQPSDVIFFVYDGRKI